MQGSGDLFTIQLVCCIKKLYFFMNIGGVILVRIRILEPFRPSLPTATILVTP